MTVQTKLQLIRCIYFHIDHPAKHTALQFSFHIYVYMKTTKETLNQFFAFFFFFLHSNLKFSRIYISVVFIGTVTNAVKVIGKSSDRWGSDLPFGYGVSHSVRKSTMGQSISSTAVLFPCITVRQARLPTVSYDKPPHSIMNGSLNKTNEQISIFHDAK